jgi:hypothetical protein
MCSFFFQLIYEMQRKMHNYRDINIYIGFIIICHMYWRKKIETYCLCVPWLLFSIKTINFCVVFFHYYFIHIRTLHCVSHTFDVTYRAFYLSFAHTDRLYTYYQDTGYSLENYFFIFFISTFSVQIVIMKWICDVHIYQL